MKKIVLATGLIFAASPVFAKCVVEILDKNGDPVGYAPYLGDSCANPKARCEAALGRMRLLDLKCEVTLDIGSRTPNESEKNSHP